MSEPIEAVQRERMNKLAVLLDSTLNPQGNRRTNPVKWGFVLLAFRFGSGGGKRDRMNYISNSSREDIIAALKELVANFEADSG